MHRSVRRIALPVLLCCTGTVVVANATGGIARAASIYSATTDAAAIRLSIHDPNVVPLLAGGGTDFSSPQAQATADSFSRARALASLAYPGDDIAGLSTFLGVVLPPSAPVRQLPPYPLTVTADQTTTHPDAITSPAYDLAASVDPGRTTSTASAGASPLLSPGGNATASGTVAATPTGGVAATAKTVTTGFQLAGLVSLGTVTTSATATRTATGTLQRHSSFDLTGASVAGLPIAVRDGKLVVPVLGTALDLNEAIATLPALETLKSQGVTITLQAATVTPNGVTAPGLRITLTRDLPALPLPSVPLPALLPQQPQVGPLPAHTLTVVYTVGYASAAATLAALPDFTAGLPAGQPSAAAPALANTTTVQTPAALPQSGLAPLATGDSPPELAPDEVPAAAAAPLFQASRREPLDIAGLYLAIVLTALASLALGRLVRRAGIRTGALTS